MALSLFDKHRRRRLRTLPRAVSDLIVDVFTRRSGAPSDAANERAMRFWDNIRNRELWLACDCNSNGQPLLHTVDGYILRCNDASEHDEKCPFRNRSNHTGFRVNPVRLRSTGDLGIHERFAERIGPKRKVSLGGGVAARRLPKISNVLFRALDAAGLNVLKHDEWPNRHETQVQRLLAAARNLPLASHGNQTEHLSDWLIAGTADGDLKPLFRLKDKIRSKVDWPQQRGRPHGFSINISSGFSPAAANGKYAVHVYGWKDINGGVDKNAIWLEARPQIFAENGDNQDGEPYISIASFTKPYAGYTVVFGLRCFMQPAYSADSLFPVDSGYERKTLGMLLSWRKDLLADHNLTMTIRKPLFDEKVTMPDGEEMDVRPDFVLDIYRGREFLRTVAVETMGFKDDEYFERKCRTHRGMRHKYGYLVQHDLSVAEGDWPISNRRFRIHLEMAAVEENQFWYDTIKSDRDTARE